MNDESAELEAMLDWQPPETRGEHTFRRAAATPEFTAIYAENREAMHALGIRFLASHTGGTDEYGWFSDGKHATAPPAKAQRPPAATPPATATEPPAWAWLLRPLRGGKTLLAHQREGVKWLLKVRLGILAGDMGTGKTLQAIVAADRIATVDGARTVIICPAGLRDTWEREATANGFTVETHSWAKLPRPDDYDGQPFTLIGDECHAIQNSTSLRGRGFLALAAHAHAVFCLTGTPMKNGQPKNLFPLLKAIRHPLGDDKFAFERQFCDAKLQVFGGWSKDGKTSFKCKRCGAVNEAGRTYPSNRVARCRCGDIKRLITAFSATGATNTDQLHAAIAPVILRRLKSECLDLPPKTRVLKEVEPTAEARAAYKAALAEMRKQYEERVAAGEITDEAEALAMLTFIRQAASLAKLEFTIGMVEEVIEQGGQAIIFTEFVEPAKRLAEHFKVPCYIGDATRPERTEIEAQFQAGQRKVFVGTIKAGGVGITLTAANTVILHDRPLTPGDADQAEDRAHRHGTRWPVTVIWPQAFEVDRKIDALLESKREVSERVLAGKTVERGESGAIQARQVLGELFSRKRGNA